MNRKERDKVMRVLAVILVPLMVYLLFSNLRNAGRRSRVTSEGAGQAPASGASAASSPYLAGGPGGGETGGEAIDPPIAEEQRRISALLPRSNPFSVTKRVETPVQKPPGAPSGGKMRVSGIASDPTTSRRIAVINGAVLCEGESVDGWTVVRIGADAVILDNGKEKVTVAVE